MAYADGSIGAGIAQGANEAIKNFQDSYAFNENINAQREKRRQQAELHEQQVQLGQQQIDSNSTELEKMKFQLTQMQKQQFGRDIKDGLNIFLSTGNSAGIVNTLKQNPDFAKQTFGIDANSVSLKQLSAYSPKYLKQLGFQDDVIDDPNKQVNFAILSNNGKEVPIDMFQLALGLGDIPSITTLTQKLQQNDLETQKNMMFSNFAKDIENDIASGKITKEEGYNRFISLFQGRPLQNQSVDFNVGGIVDYDSQRQFLNQFNALKTSQDKSNQAMAVISSLNQQAQTAPLNPNQFYIAKQLLNYALQSKEGSSWLRTTQKQIDDTIEYREAVKQSIGENLKHKKQDIVNNNIVDNVLTSLLNYIPNGQEYSKDYLQNLSNKTAFQAVLNTAIKAQFGSQVTEKEFERFDMQFANAWQSDAKMAYALRDMLEKQRRQLQAIKDTNPLFFQLINNGSYERQFNDINKLISSIDDKYSNPNKENTTNSEVSQAIQDVINSKNGSNNSSTNNQSTNGFSPISKLF